MLIQWLKGSRLRSAALLGFSTGIILLSGLLTLLWHVQQHTSTHADGGSIVGPPTLSAATVDAIFTRAGSPMAGTGKVVEQAARQANVDDAFALGVWWAETNDGMSGVGRGDRNPGAVRGSPDYPAGLDGYTLYPSYPAAILDWFKILRSRYVNRGLTSVYTICYSYVGTAGSASWAAKVVSYMVRYHGEVPPAPTVAPPHQIASHRPFSMGADDQPKTVDFAQREVKSSAGDPAATGQAGRTQQSLTSARPLSGQLPLVAFGLLVALVIAYYAHRVRRVSIVAEPATGMLGASAMPPIYVNEYSPVQAPVYVNQYSPVVERNTTTLLSPEWSLPSIEVEQQIFATVAGEGSAPVLPITPLPAVHEAFVGHNRVEMRPHRVRLRHAEEAPVAPLAETPGEVGGASYAFAVQEEVIMGVAYFQSDGEALPSVTEGPQSNLVPTNIRTGGGGLLRRYRLEQAQREM